MNDAANERKQLDLQKKATLQRQQELDDIQEILRSPAGFRFFKYFFREGKLTDISMTGNSWTYFHEGHRNFSKMIYSDVSEVDPKRAAQILSELLVEAKE